MVGCRHRLKAIKTWYENDDIHEQEVCMECGSAAATKVVGDEVFSDWLSDFLAERADRLSDEQAALSPASKQEAR